MEEADFPMDPNIKRIVVDALKSREIPLIDLSKALCKIEGTDEVDIVVTEVDTTTETIKITLRGSNVSYEGFLTIIEDYATVIRSIDEINLHRT